MIKCHVGRVGGCVRALALHMFGVPDIKVTDKATRKIYDAGDEIEEQVIQELKDEGYKVTHGNPYHKILQVGKHQVKLIGTPDIMLRLKKDEYPGEIKSMNYWRYRNVPDTFEKWNDKLKEKYSYQMGGYLYITGKPWIYWIIKEKSSKNDREPRIIRVFPQEVKSIQEIQARIEIAIKIFDGEEVLPDNFYNCNYCSVNDTTKNWYLSPCAGKHTEYFKKKRAIEDKPFIKRYKSILKDIKQRETDIELVKENSRKYENMLKIKYGREFVDNMKGYNADQLQALEALEKIQGRKK